MVSKGFPNVITSGRQYNIGEKPSVILYTYINLHAGTPKPHPFNLRVLDYSVVIWSYMISHLRFDIISPPDWGMLRRNNETQCYLLPSGNPFKCHDGEVLYLQPIIPP